MPDLKTKDVSLFEIFSVFFRIGLFTFGGGLAMLNVIRHELLHKKHWINNEEFLNLIIISTSIPGLIAVNCAYQLGFRMKKWAGAVFAILGVILPSFFIILLIVSYFSKGLESPRVLAFLRGSSAAVLAQILYSCVIFGRDIIFDKYSMAVVIIGLSLMFIFHLHPIIIILLSFLIRYFLPAAQKE